MAREEITKIGLKESRICRHSVLSSMQRDEGGRRGGGEMEADAEFKYTNRWLFSFIFLIYKLF